ncbi:MULTISPECIES: hypothetical protein [unclassified Streptomyces]|uniref:hypothetical protein n=1 Tax=unclassified Streptomyces TaxID=2593676 RepID=UPI0033B50972
MLSGNLVNGVTPISCPHGGRVAPAASAPSSGVRIDGHPVATATAVFTVVGCRHLVDGVPHPCATVRWTPDRGGVLVDGAPVLLDRTSALCFSAGLVPQGPPVVTSAAGEVASR